MLQQTKICNRHYICRTSLGPFLATFAANGVSEKVKVIQFTIFQKVFWFTLLDNTLGMTKLYFVSKEPSRKRPQLVRRYDLGICFSISSWGKNQIFQRGQGMNSNRLLSKLSLKTMLNRVNEISNTVTCTILVIQSEKYPPHAHLQCIHTRYLRF